MSARKRSFAVTYSYSLRLCDRRTGGCQCVIRPFNRTSAEAFDLALRGLVPECSAPLALWKPLIVRVRMCLDLDI